MTPTVAAPTGAPGLGADTIARTDRAVATLAQYLAGRHAPSTARGVNRTAAVMALEAAGVPQEVAAAVLRLSLQVDVALPGRAGGPAARATRRAEPIWRARYLVNAAQRVARKAAGQRNGRAAAVVATQLRSEQRFLAQHIAAGRVRLAAADAVDAAVRVHGPVLGWYASHDTSTRWDHQRLHGQNFQAGRPPLGMYPGADTGCRCTPGPPFAGARVINEAGV